MRLFILLIAAALSFVSFSEEREFNTPEKALSSFFPGATVKVENIVLSEEQRRRVEEIAKVPLDTRLISVYLVHKGGKVIAYGYVDTHRVRTHTESVLFVINTAGEIELVEVMSFNEPLEYMADENWLALFKGKTLGKDSVKLKRDIPNMTGATLTARALTNAARRALAIWKVLFEGKN
ncbi:FMN-binding protein [Hydrogenivirga caldilitoris]|uniref:FMN-binding protein n=1 Tax=Hydrogenivirga caldilitoris TaxID=246264 RepID=A0A497XVU8_9AQUI|nr:FMN-binding protein [Hydrogenivirga caldilitoris]RLJ70903.1 FMN-binding protein [Hydrogenivirga caldilitoris]